MMEMGEHLFALLTAALIVLAFSGGVLVGSAIRAPRSEDPSLRLAVNDALDKIEHLYHRTRMRQKREDAPGSILESDIGAKDAVRRRAVEAGLLRGVPHVRGSDGPSSNDR